MGSLDAAAPSNPLVGIFAAGRNGSTLLTRLLDGSPDLWVHPVELNYLSVFSDLARFGTVRAKTIFNATVEQPLAIHGRVATHLLMNRFAPHVAELRHRYASSLVEPLTIDQAPFDHLGDRPGSDAYHFLPALLASLRATCTSGGAGGQAIVFKSIETPYIGDYARMYPDMRFIHLVRDPVKNFGSVKRTMLVRRKKPFWYLGGDELQTFLEKRWLPHARWIVRESGAEPGRHLMVRYEDLCAQPRAVIQRVCDWLQVALPPDPIHQTVLGGRRMKTLPVSSSAGGETPEGVVADTDQALGYRPVVTARERQLIALNAGGLARALGYDTPAVSHAPLARLILALRWLVPDRRELSHPYLTRRLDFLRTAVALVQRRRWIYATLLSA